MNVKILDHSGTKEYINWVSGEFMGLTFTDEIPGGMISCTFDVPCKYFHPYQWADLQNQVEIWHGTVNVWSGLIYGLERYWSDTQGIRVDCVGWVAKLNMLTTGTDLSAEKGSTYINDHILVADAELMDWITEGKVHTGDYEIPGVLEFKPYAYFREPIDRIIEYNQDTFNFYVRNKALYFIPKTDVATLETSTEFCVGSLRQDLSEFSNDIKYSYRNTAGVVTSGSETDTDSAYPLTKRIESYSDNMTAAQAETAAEAALARHKVIGATGGVTASKIWKLGGAEVHISEIFPGQVIHIAGLVDAKASPSEVYVSNQIDTFEIQAMTYNHDSQTVDISPGQLPYKLPRWLARLSR